jgi:hypothetical protein
MWVISFKNDLVAFLEKIFPTNGKAIIKYSMNTRSFFCNINYSETTENCILSVKFLEKVCRCFCVSLYQGGMIHMPNTLLLFPKEHLVRNYSSPNKSLLLTAIPL